MSGKRQRSTHKQNEKARQRHATEERKWHPLLSGDRDHDNPTTIEDSTKSVGETSATKGETPSSKQESTLKKLGVTSLSVVVNISALFGLYSIFTDAKPKLQISSSYILSNTNPVKSTLLVVNNSWYAFNDIQFSAKINDGAIVCPSKTLPAVFLRKPTDHDEVNSISEVFTLGKLPKYGLSSVAMKTQLVHVSNSNFVLLNSTPDQLYSGQQTSINTSSVFDLLSTQPGKNLDAATGILAGKGSTFLSATIEIAVHYTYCYFWHPTNYFKFETLQTANGTTVWIPDNDGRSN